MAFVPKDTRKGPARYKTVYLREKTIQEVEQIAKDNDTSFNNVVESMIEYCLQENRDESE